MKILHITHQYPPDFVAGTELYTQTLARHQAAAGMQTAVFAPAPMGSSEPKLEDGVRIYRIGMGRRSGGQVFAHTYHQGKLARAFAAVLAEEMPDIIHIQHLMGIPFQVMASVISAGIPTIITLHDYWYGCANGQLITNTDHTICTGPDRLFLNCGRCAIARAGLPGAAIGSPLAAPLLAYRNGRLRRILTRAAKVIAPTRFVRDTYRQMGLPGDNFVVIRHGFDIPLAKIAKILQEKEQSKRPSAGLRIGYIGSIAPQKGIHILVEAVNQLPADNVSLTLYGGLDTFPDYVTDLQQMAQHPGIQFAGRINRDDVWAALADCDVVVMPTLWYESSPAVIDEVMAVQTPLIASAIGSMPEKVRDGVDGLLFPPGDAAALAQLLAQLAANPAQIAQLRQNIRPVRTISEHAQEIADLYTAVHRRPPASAPTAL